MRGILRRSLGLWCDVDDQVQEVFIRFFRNLHTLRDPKVVRSFLIGITLRVASGELRRPVLPRAVSTVKRPARASSIANCEP